MYLNTVQLQFNSHTKTLDSVNFASNSFLQPSSISNKSLLMSILKTSMNKLFQLKYILLMIFPAFVRSGNCDKSQKLISYLLTNFCNPTYLRDSIASCLNFKEKRCFSILEIWWRLGESNSWPPACKAGALPTKLSPQLINKSMFLFFCIQHLTMLVSQIWWVWQDLNLWPHAYQACALTNWATDPQIHRHEEQLVVDSYRSPIFR